MGDADIGARAVSKCHLVAHLFDKVRVLGFFSDLGDRLDPQQIDEEVEEIQPLSWYWRGLQPYRQCS